MNNNPINILVIEDNPGDYFLVKEYLEESFINATIFSADTLHKGIEIIEETSIDVILLDLTLPDGMGIMSFNAIHKKAPQVPIIILTGLGDKDIALASLKVGAQDYIVKDDCNPIVLQKSIQYGIERSKIFERLRRSQEQYKYLFLNNPLPMCAFSKSTLQFLMVNDAALKHYGYSEAEFLGMRIVDLIAENETYKKEYLQLLLQDGNPHRDVKQRKKDGALIDVEIHAHDIIIEGEEAILAVMQDVTERNEAKEQLRQSEQMFRTISENFPNGVVAILDKQLIVLYIAGKGLEAQGLKASDFESTVYTSHFTQKEKMEENLKQVFAGNNKVFEVAYDSLTYMISAVPLYEADGTISKIVIASQNITEQKLNEREKELLIEELTQNNSDLRQFSYITSHNLRAPLSNLLGIIKLLDTSMVSDPTTNLLLKNFEECTLQLNDTVNDLINILIIKNNVNAKKEKLDLRRMFEKVVASIQTTIDTNNMTVTADFDNAYEVEFNKTYLESILLNLLTNAVKYSSPKRKPQVKVRTEKIEDGIKLYFSDNGLGIDLTRYKDRIFGLYQRFHDHADSKGLGLYIVNSQIRVMNGEIDVESEVDKGTTFIITFKN